MENPVIIYPYQTRNNRSTVFLKVVTLLSRNTSKIKREFTFSEKALEVNHKSLDHKLKFINDMKEINDPCNIIVTSAGEEKIPTNFVYLEYVLHETNPNGNILQT